MSVVVCFWLEELADWFVGGVDVALAYVRFGMGAVWVCCGWTGLVVGFLRLRRVASWASSLDERSRMAFSTVSLLFSVCVRRGSRRSLGLVRAEASDSLLSNKISWMDFKWRRDSGSFGSFWTEFSWVESSWVRLDTRWTHEVWALLSVLSVVELLLVTLERGLRVVFCAFLGFLRVLAASAGSVGPKTYAPLVTLVPYPGLCSLSISFGGDSSTSMEASSGGSALASGGLSGLASEGPGGSPEGALLGVASSWEIVNIGDVTDANNVKRRPLVSQTAA